MDGIKPPQKPIAPRAAPPNQKWDDFADELKNDQDKTLSQKGGEFGDKAGKNTSDQLKKAVLISAVPIAGPMLAGTYLFKEWVPLLTVVAIFDLVQFLLECIAIGWLLNWVISIFAVLTIFVWVNMMGKWNWTYGPPLWGALFGEVIPLVNDLPFWIGIVVYIIIQEKKAALLPKAVADKLDKVPLAKAA